MLKCAVDVNVLCCFLIQESLLLSLSLAMLYTQTLPVVSSMVGGHLF